MLGFYTTVFGTTTTSRQYNKTGHAQDQYKTQQARYKSRIFLHLSQIYSIRCQSHQGSVVKLQYHYDAAFHH